jgi:hypothetical protein
MSVQSFLPQINICETLFGNIINEYDPKITNIRTYGSKKNPLFMANDVSVYVNGKLQPIARGLKHFSIPKELVREKIINKNNVLTTVNLLTKYGFMRYVSLTQTETLATICVRQYVYALFDTLELHMSVSQEQTQLFINQLRIVYNKSMQTQEVQLKISNL